MFKLAWKTRNTRNRAELNRQRKLQEDHVQFIEEYV